jgi:hypothetical protein
MGGNEKQELLLLLFCHFALHCSWDLFQVFVDFQPYLTGDLDHLVRPFGFPAHPENAIAFFKQAFRNGMKYLIETVIADLFGFG